MKCVVSKVVRHGQNTQQSKRGARWFITLSVVCIAVALLASRAATAVTITEFPIPTVNSAPNRIASGPDGNLWFTERGGNKIGRITPAGVITEFPIPTAGSFPVGITFGPDGNLWFTEWLGNKIGRITTTGTITEFPIPTAGSEPTDIASGPDGTSGLRRPTVTRSAGLRLPASSPNSRSRRRASSPFPQASPLAPMATSGSPNSAAT